MHQIDARSESSPVGCGQMQSTNAKGSAGVMSGIPWNGPGAEASKDPVVRRSFWRRNRWIWWLAGVFFAGVIVVAVVLSIVARHFEPFIRARIVEELQLRFHTHVELAAVHVSVHYGQDRE